MLQFSPGWTQTIDGRTGEILRVNRMMRGAAVGAGAHRIAYRIRPGAVPGRHDRVALGPRGSSPGSGSGASVTPWPMTSRAEGPGRLT